MKHLLILVLFFSFHCGVYSADVLNTTDKIDVAASALNYGLLFERNELSVEEKLNANNEIINNLVSHIEASGQNAKTISKEIEIEGKKYKYIALEIFNIDLENPTTSEINNLAQKYDISEINVDIVTHAVMGTGGFYRADTRELTLGFDYIVSKLVFGDMGGVARHELAHAMFARMRVEEVDSIYHELFYMDEDDKLVDFETAYEKSIDGEEVYTYAHNMYWISLAGADAFMYKNKEYLLNRLENYIYQLDIVARQISELSERTVKHQEEHALETRWTVDMYPTGIKGEYLMTADNFWAITHSNALKDLWVGTNIIRSIGARMGITLPQLDINKFPKGVQKDLLPMFAEIDKREKIVLDEHLVQVRELKRVSDFFMEENQKLKPEFDAFKQAMMSELSDEEKRVEFDKFQNRLKEFANFAIESSSSYVGK